MADWQDIEPTNKGTARIVNPDGWEDLAPEVISSEEFGGKGIITRSEEEGMFTPTNQQLAARKKRAKFDAVLEGKADYYSLSPDEQRELNFHREQQSPASFMNRVGEGVKMTPRGKAGFVRETMDSERPPLRSGDKIYVYDSKVAQYVPYNPEGFELGDVGQFAGEAVGSLPNLAAAALPSGSSPLVQGTAGAIGSVLKQGLSALLPGEDAMTFKQRLADIGISTAFATATQAGVNSVMKVIDFLKPTNVIARHYDKAKTAKTAVQGRNLLDRMNKGTDKYFLDIAQETQDPWLVGLKAAAEQSFTGKKLSKEFYSTQIKQSFKYTADVIDDIARGSKKTPAEFGDIVRDRFKKAVDKAYTARTTQADADYAIFNNPQVRADGTKYFPEAPISNFLTKVKEAGELYSNLRTTLKKGISIGKHTIKEGDDMLTISAMHDTRKILGKIARGNGKLFDGLDPGSERKIAKELLKGIDDDFAMAGDWVGGDLKGALDTANKNYARNSEVIRGLRSTVVGKALKTDTLRPGETITNALLRAKPEELNAIFKITEFEDPVFHQGLKEQYTRGLLTAGIKGGKDIPTGMTPYNPKKANAAMIGKDRDTFKLIFQKGEERAAYLDALRFNQRIFDIPALKAGLTPAQESGELMAIAGGAATGNAASLSIFGSKFLAKWYYGETAAKMIFDKQGQKALRTLVATQPGTKAHTTALMYTIERTMMEPDEESVAEQFPEGEQ